MKYQVAEYTIDTTLYRITAGGSAVPVEPKVFDLLVYLIRHRDRVLSREELFKEVWDGREVSDATLSNHVKSARKILGDSREKLDVMAAALMKYETIDEEQLKDIMAGRVPRAPSGWDESGAAPGGQGGPKPEPVIGPPASQT